MSGTINEVGQYLKAEREKRAITLDVVHETTKVPLDSLRAIEEGYKIRTLTTFYYKSFVKIYAQYLGLDVSAVLAMIPSTHAEAKIVVDRPKPVDVRSTRELNLFARHVDHHKAKKVIVVIAAGLAGILVVFLLVMAVQKIAKSVSTAVTSPSDNKPSDKKASVKREAQKASSKKDNSKAVVTAPVSAKAEREAASGVKALQKISLTAQAQSTAWIVVKADGKTVFQGSLKKGNSETWTAEKRIELAGKGIDRLLYEANGKTLGKISRMNAKVKKIIVTPDGLTIEK